MSKIKLTDTIFIGFTKQMLTPDELMVAVGALTQMLAGFDKKHNSHLIKEKYKEMICTYIDKIWENKV